MGITAWALKKRHQQSCRCTREQALKRMLIQSLLAEACSTTLPTNRKLIRAVPHRNHLIPTWKTATALHHSHSAAIALNSVPSDRLRIVPCQRPFATLYGLQVLLTYQECLSRALLCAMLL